MEPTVTSLRTKLVRTMVATLLVVAFATLFVVAGLNYLTSRSTLANIEGHLRRGIEQKGTGLVTNQALALRDLVTDNAFGDVSRLVERSVEDDDQVIFGLFLSADMRPWGYAVREGGRVHATADWRTLAAGAETPLRSGVRTEVREVLGQTVYQFAAMVVDDKGAYLGSLRYGLSDLPLRQALTEARAESRRALTTTVVLLLLLGAGTSIVGVLRSRKAAARITRPLADLTGAVNAFARGDRRTRVAIDSGDEIQLLGAAFNNMATELEDYYARLEHMNRTLEVKVEERTRALGERNRDMRLVLDNVDQGLLTVSLDGRLAPERAAIVDRWFGAPGPSADFVGYVRRVDPTFADVLEVGLEALRDDFMPAEVVIAQLPARLRREEREYHCTYGAIHVAGRLEGLLIVIKDVTAEMAHARQEADGKERLALFNAVAKSRLGFLAFVDEANDRLAQLTRATVEVQRRTLHTLKGNAGMMGLEVLAGICHRLEDRIADSLAPLDEAGFAPLQRRWRELTDVLRTLVGEKPRDVMELSRTEIAELVAELDAGASPAFLRGRLAALMLEPADRQLRRLGSYGQTLANRLGKGDLLLKISDGGVRLGVEEWEGLWAELVHVVRNAVDHGIDAPAARLAAGKSRRPGLRLETYLEADALVVEIEDDGAGIDWDAVRAAAERCQLPHATESELIAALFSEGLTTQVLVTETSGRGIGLAAVRRQVERRGGAIAVASRRGAGSTFTFTFPLAQIGPSLSRSVVSAGTVRRSRGDDTSQAIRA